MYTEILYDVADGIATLTLNRPEKLNAFTETMRREMLTALDAVDADDAVRALVVTGAGRAFCAGADLSRGGATFDVGTRPAPAGGGPWRDGGGTVTLRLFELKKPVIAAVNGAAVGIGATMQLAMDVRLASSEARFGFVFSRRGVVPEACSTWFLPRIVGLPQALLWAYSGRVFGAEEAREGRLVNEVVAPDALLPRARALAREITADTSAVSVALIRQMFWRMLGAPHPMAAHKVESRGLAAMGRLPDAYEGVQSFLEKRPARFPMRVSRDMPDLFPDWTEPPFG
jgi:enoyl-CoA hydratase/carnithine racemase